MPFDPNTAREVEPKSKFDPSTAMEVPSEEEGIVSDVVDVGTEIMSAVNRGVVNIADFLTTDQINAILQLSGSEKRVPSIESMVEPAVVGGTMEPGLTRDIIRTGGEMVGPGVAVGQALRAGAAQLPRVVSGAESVGTGVLRQLGAATPAADIGYSAVSGAGAEIGREVGGEEGALVGSFLAPVSVVGGQAALKGLLNAGRSGISALTKSMEGMSDEGAATLLAEAMVREGLSPEDVTRQLAQLGPEGLPADVGINFSRLLRTASNKIPRIEGQAAEVLGARQAGQGNRLLTAFDDATGTPSLNVDDEIVRLNKSLGPQVRALYDATRSKPLAPSPKLSGLLKGDNSVTRAMASAQTRLADKRAAGDTISNIDVIDATKQVMDDQIGKAIRQGENNKARDLVRLKNIMVEEADKAIPEYKQARSLYAGKAALENAADAGAMFVKMKPRDVENITKTMGESEKRMFKLGAKQAILDRIDTMQTSADAVKRLFGKGGDVKKLRALFDNKDDFNRFSDVLKREADFILTRRAAQANSTTAKQLSDEMMAGETLNAAREAISSPVGAASALGRVVGGLSAKKTDEAYIGALEEAGDILLTKGMDPTRLQALLRRGSAKQIEQVFRRAIKPNLEAPLTPPITTGAVAETLRGPQESQEQNRQQAMP